MIGEEDEEKPEGERQPGEGKKPDPIDDLYDRPRRIAASGFVDGRSNRRTGRVLTLPVRAHPRVKAIVDFILQRDGLPSSAVLFEIMLRDYLKAYGELKPADIPTIEAIVERLLRKRDEDDAE